MAQNKQFRSYGFCLKVAEIILDYYFIHKQTEVPQKHIMECLGMKKQNFTNHLHEPDKHLMLDYMGITYYKSGRENVFRIDIDTFVDFIRISEDIKFI